MTSSPESRRGLGIGWFEFHSQEERGVWGKAKFCRIFIVKMKGNSFAEIRDDFVQSPALGYHADFEAFCNVMILAFSDEDLDVVLECSHK